ncbi:ribonuclease H-like domain-containing protein [Tanacetum coccineum]
MHFFHGHLKETVYMHQPPGFTDSAHSDYVCLLQMSTYGLKQTPSLEPDIAYLLLHVDDIIRTASSTSLLQRIISLLHTEFAMTDLGPLNYFLGISATRTTSGILLSQTKYATEILVQQLCLYMHDPREPHLNAMKRVLLYLRGTTDLGLQLFRSNTSQLIAYSDADWAGCPATRRSTSGYCVFLGDNSDVVPPSVWSRCLF